jgi:uncharacterized protein YceK
MNTEKLMRIAVLATAAILAGCGSYYKVTDPTSQRVYYTEEVERPGKGTTIMFKDAKTGAEVTLPASEVIEVSSEEFGKATAK